MDTKYNIDIPIKNITNRRRSYSSIEYMKLKKKYYKQIFVSAILFTSFIAAVGLVLFLFVTNNRSQTTINNLKSEITRLENEINDYEKKTDSLNEDLMDASKVIDSLYIDLEVTNKSLEEAEDYIEETIAAPSSKKYNRNTDLSISEVITEDRMNRIINYWNAKNGGKSPFVNNGKAFIKASQITGYDPIFLFAICSHESGFGTSKIAREKGNYCGIGAYDNSPYTSAISMQSNTVEESIIKNAQWIHDHYYKENQKTLNSMIYGKKCYSSSKDGWINGICSIMNKSMNIK